MGTGLCTFFLSSNSLFFASDFKFYDLPIELPSLSISAITQDSRGNIWLGTRDCGIIKCTGNSIEVFSRIPFEENVLPSNQIQSMYMENDLLWVGTYSGLASFDTLTHKITHYPLIQDIICSVLRDSKGRLWVGTLGKGLFILDDITKEVVNFNSEEKENIIPNNTVRNLYEDSKGNVYACTYDGVFVLNEEKFSFERPLIFTPDNPSITKTVYAVFEDEDGNFWSACWDRGLVRTNPQTKKWEQFSLPDNRIYCVNTSVDSSSFVVGTWGGGLHVFNKDTKEIQSFKNVNNGVNNIAHNTIYSTFVDRNGLLWVGTNGGGISLCDVQRSWFKTLAAKNENYVSISDGNIQYIEEDNTGSLWIGIKNQGICHYNPKTSSGKDYLFSTGEVPFSLVYCIHQAKNGEVYVATNKGLFQFDKQTDTFVVPSWYTPYLSSSNTETVYCVTDAGDDLWVGTYGGGVFRYSITDGSIKQYTKSSDIPNSLSDNLVYFIQEDSRKNIWIGTNRGVNRYNSETDDFSSWIYDSSNPKGIGGQSALCMVEASDGNLLFGFKSSGFSIFNPTDNLFKTITTKNGLPSNHVVGISQSKDNNFWVATNKGVCLYNPLNDTIYNYKIPNTLQRESFTSRQKVSSAGYVYFPFTKGVVYFKPEEIAKPDNDRSAPATAITYFSVNGEQIPEIKMKTEKDNPLRFTSNECNFTFEYSSLDFSPLSKPEFEYIMENYDTSWKHSGNRNYTRYTNLKPGSYVFKVRNSEHSFFHSGPETSLHFVIEKPIYARWYFIVLYVVASTGLLFLLHKLKEFIVLKQEMKQLELARDSLQKSNKFLEQISYIDSLTGIDNRRSFIRLVEEIWCNALSKKENVHICMIDIDFFKICNDTFGHVNGDAVLCTVASQLKSVLAGENGIICRYGGEEFLVILINYKDQAVLEIAEQMRKKIAAEKIQRSHKAKDFITISVGVYGEMVREGSMWSEYVQKADIALYDAKNSGRNRIEVYTSKERK